MPAIKGKPVTPRKALLRARPPLAKQITRARYAQGMTQAALAQAVGYHHWQTINEIERGVARPSEVMLARIFTVLGIPLEDGDGR
jgi:transcriptional regulator with XRE-family HTH domain